MPACRLNQTDKLSVREVYPDHTNYDHDHDLIPDIYWAHETAPGNYLRLGAKCPYYRHKVYTNNLPHPR
jgi:hypothetical protein